MTVFGCDKELNAHFYSAASLKYHVPDTWYDTTPGHIILTLGQPVLALPRKSRVPSEEQLVPFFTTLECGGPGSNPWPPVPQSRHSTELSGLVGKKLRLNIHWPWILLAKFWHARYLTNGILWNVERKWNYARLRREKKWREQELATDNRYYPISSQFYLFLPIIFCILEY